MIIMLGNTKYHSVEDYLKDTDFIKYVLDDDKTYVFFWAQYLGKHPEMTGVFERAKDTLLHIDECTFMSQEDKQQLKSRIFSTLSIK